MYYVLIIGVDTDYQPVATSGTGLGSYAHPKMSLSPHRETHWSRTKRWIVWNFQILVVSAVKICQECLQTAPAPYRGFDLGPRWGNSVLRPPNENSCRLRCHHPHSSVKRKINNKMCCEPKPDHPRIRHRHAFLLLWPWPWPGDLDIRNWPRYSDDVGLPAYQKMKFPGEGFQKLEPD